MIKGAPLRAHRRPRPPPDGAQRSNAPYLAAPAVCFPVSAFSVSAFPSFNFCFLLSIL
jgi:hypothetical protein